MESLFSGIVTKIQTTADGGWRIYIDCDQTQAQEILKLSDMMNQFLSIAIVEPSNEDN